jgi:prolyl oligopeptidase
VGCQTQAAGGQFCSGRHTKLLIRSGSADRPFAVPRAERRERRESAGYGAVVINVPLLDMRRYNKLLAGASWMAEYGNPDKPEEWAFISKYSPYQNVQAGTTYPRPLFTTTTRDDRVHPGHARKMAAKMLEQGHEVLYYENTEGGHGAGVTPEQRARMMALTYTYLWTQLKEGVVP